MTASRTNRQDLVPIDDCTVDALIEIGRQRAQILEAMKEALGRGDEDEALERARELMGLPSKRPNRTRKLSKSSVG